MHIFKNGDYAIALYDFNVEGVNEISMQKNDKLVIVKIYTKKWLDLC